ncbi:MAG: HyaD/HybD family hydrogenase maturation endopeptidase [Alphaproteobacteria bacterium]|nr:HyaD/HybD family hydrogenase maturation endopeptidase [Alphaproteobacteria bacterium]MBF0251780.1 HyaD/HybD family hydrogenase maturation endopeptidase [Alphaproteobacteria bacterium]
MGNVLMQDEGVGVCAAEALENRYDLPPNVEVVDGGTTGTELMAFLRDRPHVIMADAVNTGAQAGTLVRLSGDEVPAFFQTKISSHQLGVSDLLGLLTLQNEAPGDVVIIGMVPYQLENKLGLSEQTLARIDAMVAMLVDELARLGVKATPKANPTRGYWERQAHMGESASCV